ncbi:protein of unknown function [Pararobbsia alpina]
MPVGEHAVLHMHMQVWRMSNIHIACRRFRVITQNSLDLLE